MPNTQWPETAMVGYIDCAAIGAVAAITEQQVKSYNVVIFCFANADGTVPSAPPYQDFTSTLEKIKQWENPGTVNLLSIGGAIGDVDISPSAVNKTVSNLIASIATLQLDGVDLDIEQPHISSVDILNFSRLLRTELDKTNAFLTCAPILAGSNDLPTLNTPNGGPSWAEVYGPNGVVFDAINVQAYNSGTEFTYTDPATGNLVSEASANIVRAGYDALQQRGNIHPQSRIVMGVPCDEKSANVESNCWNPASPAKETAETLVTNVQEVMQGDFGIEPSAFGGLMTWSISNDAYFSSPVGFFAENVASKVLQLVTNQPIKETA